MLNNLFEYYIYKFTEFISPYQTLTTNITVKPEYDYIITDAGGSSEISNPRFQGHFTNKLQVMFTSGTTTTMYKEIIVVAIKTK